MSLKKPSITFAAKQDTRLELSGGGIRFSPDGKRLLGLALNGGVLLHDLASGSERTVIPQMKSMMCAEWTHDSAALIIAGAGMDGVTGLYRVDAVSGVATLLAGERLARPFAPSRDGQTVFYSRAGEGVFAHDLGTGQDRLLLPLPPGGRDWIGLRLSHDGGKLAVNTTQRLAVIDLTSGRVQEIYASPKGSFEMIWALEWSADDRELLTIFRVTANIDRMDLVTFPATGGPPVRQPIDKEFRGLAMSPDGRYLGTARVSQRVQVWALENFLPKSAK